jgi:hypothetical protein
MAQPSRTFITFEQVELVANDLKKQGKYVSTKAVREQLGTGSYSTISKFLKQMADCENSNLSYEDYSSKLPEKLRNLIQDIYYELIDATKRARWASHVKDKIKLNRALEAEKQISSVLSSGLKELTEKSVKDYELLLSLTERAAKAESKVEHLEARHATLSKNFEKLEEHSRQQLRVESQMHLLKVAKLEQDLMNSQNRVIELARELAGIANNDAPR